MHHHSSMSCATTSAFDARQTRSGRRPSPTRRPMKKPAKIAGYTIEKQPSGLAELNAGQLGQGASLFTHYKASSADNPLANKSTGVSGMKSKRTCPSTAKPSLLNTRAEPALSGCTKPTSRSSA